jgi:two-component system chemotaxis sensor kinase CheA
VPAIEDAEIVKEFLIESNENLGRLDQEIVELEQRPKDTVLLASVFRTFHTIKGACGMLGFQNLEGITHAAENLLSQFRSGARELTPGLVSVILQTVDVVKQELAAIEGTGAESVDPHQETVRTLKQACDGPAVPESAAAPATAPDPETAIPQKSVTADSTIRVNVSLLDKLMNLVGELVLTRNQILQVNSRQEDAGFNGISQRLNLITTELQEGVMKTRMQPIGVVWKKLPRLVRDLAAASGKRIQVTTDGEETELDRTIIEAINDPLTHLIRNCCDHGIEDPATRAKRGKPPVGTISLRAYHEGGQVNIEINDDGGGIDVERVKEKAVAKGLLRKDQAAQLSERELLSFIFLPGFSTAQTVTSVSGRGVGMDVVKTNIEHIGGSIDLSSRAGKGATIRLKIPLTLAIIPGLIVVSGAEKFIIPQVCLLELICLEGEAGKKQIEEIYGARMYRRRGVLLPLVSLNEVLELSAPADPDAINIVVLQAEGMQFGLIVDGICDTQEIVVKPLGKELKTLCCYAGSTILGDGSVALILDVLGIAQRARIASERHERTAKESGEPGTTEDCGELLLLFRAGKFSRLAAPLSLVARLEEFPQSQIEHAGGRPVVQYRGQILSLTAMAGILNAGELLELGGRDPLQTIVFRDGGEQVGVVIDEILDIIQAPVTGKMPSRLPGLSGSGVVDGKLADFIDLHAVVLAADGRNGYRDP